MPKFAPVAPIQVLEGLWAAGSDVFGEYHLLLAHHTVEHATRFADLFKRIGSTGWAGTVIMDNSIVELGNSVDFEMVDQATRIIKDNCPTATVVPVLPDVMGNGIQTRQAVYDAYPRWKDEMSGDGLMVVVQGSDFEDYLESLNFFTSEHFPKITMLGIPRILHKTCGSRINAMRQARQYKDSHKIHLLGFCDDITNDVDSSMIYPGCGIDSAVPLRVREMFTEFLQAGPRSPTWFETAQVDKTMLANLDAARKLFRGPSPQ